MLRIVEKIASFLGLSHFLPFLPKSLLRFESSIDLIQTLLNLVLQLFCVDRDPGKSLRLQIDLLGHSVVMDMLVLHGKVVISYAKSLINCRFV